MNRKNNFGIPVFIRVLLIIITIISCGTKEQKTLKLAHSLDPSHSVHIAMEFMAERLKEKSDGQVTIDIYPSGQLGSERENLELLQIGSLAITKVSSAVLEGFIEEYKVLGLPYIFVNEEHYYNVLEGEVGQKMLMAGEDIWLRGLCFYDAGSRSFYTKEKPIKEPDDLKGMKIRVMKSISAVNMVKALGGTPTPISWGELYTALQSGVVDGAENNPPSFYLSRHYEVCKYYSLDEHTSVPDVMLISKLIWDKLTEQEQQWLQEAVDESVEYQKKLWAESEEEALREVQKAGVEVYHPDKSKFREKVKPLYEEAKENEVLRPLVEKIQAMAPDIKTEDDEEKN
ncbi:MAG: DctP family TRAP transporter solute-binding subunit [Bacteroidetes bacterium]|jgi:tripartite ATP-independent transporter DctP family solute receptor|nr:DctP family TRAP transporter solute-binding subunit [Bacteroidota bacterium]